MIPRSWRSILRIGGLRLSPGFLPGSDFKGPARCPADRAFEIRSGTTSYLTSARVKMSALEGDGVIWLCKAHLQGREYRDFWEGLQGRGRGGILRYWNLVKRGDLWRPSGCGL